MDDHDWLQAVEHIRKTDRKLFDVYMQLKNDGITFTDVIEHPKEVRFEHIIESIVSQQLSVKASDTIYKRFTTLVKKVTPEQILLKTIEELRSVGISRPKANYILGIAQAVQTKQISLDYMSFLTEEEIIRELTKLKGIGVWSSEMFMMFTLGKPNIFSYTDQGLYNAFKQIYKLDWKDKEDKIKADCIIANYAPYKTYASKILWKSLDNEPK